MPGEPSGPVPLFLPWDDRLASYIGLLPTMLAAARFAPPAGAS